MLRGGGTSRVLHTTAVRNGQWDLSLKADGGAGIAANNASSGSRNGNSYSSWTNTATGALVGPGVDLPTLDLTLPAGTVAQRWSSCTTRSGPP